jgi:23S rRNA maturation-related 3'-5' exoribonuclease YhaM
MSEISRGAIVEDLPEIDDIQASDLREKVIDAWVFALGQSSFNRVTDIPGEGSPTSFHLTEGMQDVHIRGVVRLSRAICDEFRASHPNVEIDDDIILAGAICHDIGKAWEADPVNLKRWREQGDRYGEPSYRHSVYGVHVCLSAGLPEEVAHICLGHSREGDFIGLSTECYIVRQADMLWWRTAAALGLCKDGTTDQAGKNMRARRRP